MAVVRVLLGQVALSLHGNHVLQRVIEVQGGREPAISGGEVETRPFFQVAIGFSTPIFLLLSPSEHPIQSNH